ncbi:tetratricopeptide repeat protein [Algoriphagus sp. Y33]|uniref:tetratricopeptide repeat protein n=1 Tax=Algoriphagus sp. Y33 TaxID=2772483 RepID=UPI0017836FDA|nr:tetratricopeptide repeat protein [Algoriphagus sp. Y33]
MSHCRHILLHVCLLLIPYNLYSQQIPRSEADSLLSIIHTTKLDSNRVKIWIELGQFQMQKARGVKADLDSASTYVQKAYELSRQLKYYAGECRSLNLLGTISHEAWELDQSIAYHKSAIELYRKQRDWKGEAESYLLLAWARRDKGDVDEARKDIQKAIALSKDNSDQEGMGEAYIEWGNTYANFGEELNEKINYYQEGLQFFESAGDKMRQANVHKDLGDLYRLQGSTGQALLELRKSLALYRSIGYLHVQGVYDLLGTLFSELGEYEEGLKYGLLAVQTAETLGDTTLQLSTIYNRLGATYSNLKQYQKAHIYFNKAMHIAQKCNDRSSIIKLTYNITSVLNELGQPNASVQLLLSTAEQYPPQNNSDSIISTSHFLLGYTLLKKHTIAQRYFKQLIQLSEKLGKREFMHKIIYYDVINFLVESKQYALAKNYSDEFEEYCRATNYLPGASQVQFFRFKLDSMQANYPSAIHHYQQYKLLQDSLLNETKNHRIASLEVLHEIEKKEKDIQLKEQNIKALTKERILQEQKIKQDRVIRNGIIGGAALLLILLTVIYNRYRSKQQSNKLLQAQQDTLKEQQQQIQEKNQALEQLVVEKERLLKEIHHRVKNNLQLVMSLLNSQVASLQDKVALSAIQDSQNRVQAMALIHQKLYQAEGVARIPMKAYIEELVAYLQDSYTHSRKVNFKLLIGQIELDVNMSVPLGLIINEAITNAFKYAFPEENSGTVLIGLLQKSDTSYELTIEDDGVGFPKAFDPLQSRSLGMTLIHGFSAQLDAELNLESNQGVKISLVFTDERLSHIQNKVDYAY